MEKSRFDDLMRRYTNWVSDEADNEVYTFFDGLYTHKDAVGHPIESGTYITEYDEVDREMKIELSTSGNRYLVQGFMDGNAPILQLNPIDHSGDRIIRIVPKVYAVHA